MGGFAGRRGDDGRATLLGAPLPASAAPCPDIEVTFARGTAEPPGVGGVGQAFVEALRSQAGARSLGVYPVNYPPTTISPPRHPPAPATPALTSSPWWPTAPTPSWCSADIPRAPW
ncbi:cutinase family protein [Mycobacterium avium subsp. avium 2285 (R)]|nr:cutinase family protein [Mycobacterium avium subsp. avium 2285 (R)]